MTPALFAPQGAFGHSGRPDDTSGGFYITAQARSDGYKSPANYDFVNDPDENIDKRVGRGIRNRRRTRKPSEGATRFGQQAIEDIVIFDFRLPDDFDLPTDCYLSYVNIAERSTYCIHFTENGTKKMLIPSASTPKQLDLPREVNPNGPLPPESPLVSGRSPDGRAVQKIDVPGATEDVIQTNAWGCCAGLYTGKIVEIYSKLHLEAWPVMICPNEVIAFQCQWIDLVTDTIWKCKSGGPPELDPEASLHLVSASGEDDAKSARGLEDLQKLLAGYPPPWHYVHP